MESTKVLIEIDPELWKSAKIEAIKASITVSKWVTLAIKNELNHKD